MEKTVINQPESIILADKESRDNICAFFDLLHEWDQDESENKKQGFDHENSDKR